MEMLKEKLDEIKLKPIDLEKNFNLALEDEKFKNLVSKIKLPKKTLKLYTSLLEASSLEYDNCLKCSCLSSCPNKITGYVYLPKIVNDKLEFQYKACRFKEMQIKENEHLKNIYLYDVPLEIKQASMKNIYTNDKNRFEIIKWMKDFIDNYPNNKHQKGLYLYGSFGCGKTYLLAALFNEMAKKNVKSAIVFWPEYLRDLKSSFNTDYNTKINHIKKVPLLLIDDIGAESVTSWGRDEILCSIVQYRMQEKLPTFFTSNLDIKALEKHLSTSKDEIDEVKSRRVIERIKQLTEEKGMISKNLRS